MVYQIKEKNQIFIALFAIIVLCAGKLFKDYLYRNKFVEGLTVIPLADRPLGRGTSDTANVILYLNLKLGVSLRAGGTITVTWPSNTGVITTTTPGDYTVVSGMTPASNGGVSISNSSLNNTSTLTLTNGANTVNSGTQIKISIASVTITSGDSRIDNFAFTTTTSVETTPIVTPVIILGYSSGSIRDDTTSVKEIRNAINNINERLKSSPSPGTEETTSLLAARSALVTVLAYTYGTVKEAGKVFDSEALYEAQKTAIDFIRTEKARARSNATILKDDNSNKRRMAQVNTYYTRNYEANTEVMKNIIYVSIALIVLALLRNKEYIPASISTLGIIFVLTMGGIIIGGQVFDIMRRNDHDFDKYDWNFNEDELNKKKLIQQNANPADLSEMGLAIAPCYGQGCCEVGTTWDSQIGRCISDTGRIDSTSTAVWAKPAGGASTGTLTINLQVKSALTANSDKIYIQLPSELFTIPSGTATVGGVTTGTISTADLSSEREFTVSNAVTLSSGIGTATVTINNIAVLPNANLDFIHKVISRTTKEPNKIGLIITGLK